MPRLADLLQEAEAVQPGMRRSQTASAALSFSSR